MSKLCYGSIVAILILGCSDRKPQPLPRIQTSECDSLDLCSLCQNATGLVRADVQAIGNPALREYEVKDLSGNVLGVTESWFTSVTVQSVRQIRGVSLNPANEVLFPAKISPNGTIEDGPMRGVALRDAAGNFKPLYLFVRDRFDQFQNMVLHCGGVYWPETRADGGMELTSSFFPYTRSNGLESRSGLSESEFLADVNTHWGSSSCPPLGRPDGG